MNQYLVPSLALTRIRHSFLRAGSASLPLQESGAVAVVHPVVVVKITEARALKEQITMSAASRGQGAVCEYLLA